MRDTAPAALPPALSFSTARSLGREPVVDQSSQSCPVALADVVRIETIPVVQVERLPQAGRLRPLSETAQPGLQRLAGTAWLGVLLQIG